MKSKVLAIIPARGGSKGIPRKNIRLLAGKPLIAYTIEEAKKSKYISRVIVSTEDGEIAKISGEWGAEIIERSPELAKDETPTIEVILDHLKSLRKEERYTPDVIVLLQPTSPLRTTEDIDNAIELFLKCQNCLSLISVTELDHPPFWTMKIENKFLKPIFDNKYFGMRRQELPRVYRPNGAIFISSPQILKEYKSFYSDKTLPYIMPKERSVDIDDENDLILSEILIRQRGIDSKGEITNIRIGNRLIGEGKTCFIVAEAGVNHNGNIRIAKRLIDAAVDSGADAVKFQTFHADKMLTRTAEKAEYQKETTGEKETQYEMIKKLELSFSEFEELKQYSEKRGIMFLSSPFDRESVDLLEKLGVPAFKVGSGEITNLPLLKYIAKKNKPVILSTGMSYLDEVKEAVTAIKEEGNNQIILLHAVSNYPARIEDVNLRAMITMRKSFDLPVGYSDHTPGITVPIAAVVMGASVIEKHFTLDRNMEGPDHRASLEPKELKEMVRNIRLVEKSLGSGEKKPVDLEMEMRKTARKSIVAKIDIPEGTIITKEMLAVKRPGTGISPKYLDKIVGKKTKTDIKKDKMLKWEEII